MSTVALFLVRISPTKTQGSVMYRKGPIFTHFPLNSRELLMSEYALTQVKVRKTCMVFVQEKVTFFLEQKQWGEFGVIKIRYDFRWFFLNTLQILQ